MEAESILRLGLAGTEADRDLAGLFPALTARVTDKREYPPDPVEPPRVAPPEGIALHYIAAPTARALIADLHRQAVAELAATGSTARREPAWAPLPG